jgi:hypothetical protein
METGQLETVVHAEVVETEAVEALQGEPEVVAAYTEVAVALYTENVLVEAELVVVVKPEVMEVVERKSQSLA